MEYSPKGPKWSPVNQLNQVKQGKDSLRDYIARIKHLNTRCEPHITSFETCSKEVIKLGDNMREGDETHIQGS